MSKQSTQTLEPDTKIDQFAVQTEQNTKSSTQEQELNSAKITEAETMATDAMILSSSKFLAEAIVNSLRELTQDGFEDQELTYQQKIQGFLVFTRSYTMFTGTELVYCVWLVLRLTHADRKRIQMGHKQQITEENIGTILVCAVELALKMLRDRVCRNSWWSNAFGMDMKTLNASEIVFLKRLDFSLNIDEVSFWTIYDLLFSFPLPAQSKSL